MTVEPTTGNAHASRGRSPLFSAWLWLVEGLAAIGTVSICILMVIICADIVARNAMGSSLPLISELGALILVMIVALQLAATVRADRLARTDVFFVPFRGRFPRGGSVLSAIFNLVGAIMVGCIAWATLHTLGKDLDSGEFIGVPGIATLPVWPFRVMILTGMTIAAIEFARQMLVDLWQVMAGGGEA